MATMKRQREDQHEKNNKIKSIHWFNFARSNGKHTRNPTKMLYHVTVLQSCGPIRVIIPVESTVDQLINAVIQQYVKEGRKPLPVTHSSCFELHCAPCSTGTMGTWQCFPY